MKELAKQNPQMTAVFVSNYEMTVGATIESNEIGIRIPEDLSVIGFDNIEFAKASNPKLSIVTQPTKRNRQKCSRTDIGQTGQSNPGDASERNEVKDQFCRRKIRTHFVCMTRCTISLSRKPKRFGMFWRRT